MNSNSEEVNVLEDGANGMEDLNRNGNEASDGGRKPEFKLNIKKEIDYINQFVREELKEVVFKRLFDCFSSSEPFVLEQEIMNALEARRAEAEEKKRTLEKNPYADSEKMKMVAQVAGMDWSKAINSYDYEVEGKEIEDPRDFLIDSPPVYEDEIEVRDLGEFMSFGEEKKPSTDSEKMNMVGEDSGSGQDWAIEEEVKDPKANRRYWIDSPDPENQVKSKENQEPCDQWDDKDQSKDRETNGSPLTAPPASENQPEELSLDANLLMASEKKKALQKTPEVCQKPGNDWTNTMNLYDDEDQARDRESRNRYLIDPPVSNLLLDNWPLAQMRLQQFRERNDIDEEPTMSDGVFSRDVLKFGSNMQMGCPQKRRIYELKKKEPTLEFPLPQNVAAKPEQELKTLSYVEGLLRDPEEFQDIEPDAKMMNYLEGMEREAKESEKTEPQAKEFEKNGPPSKMLSFADLDPEELRKREEEAKTLSKLETLSEWEEFFKAKEAKEGEKKSTILNFAEGMFRDMEVLRKMEQEEAARKDSESKKPEADEMKKTKPKRPIPPSPKVPESGGQDEDADDGAMDKETCPKDDYSYNMYGIFAMAGSKLTPCYEINDIHGFSTEIREAMRHHIIGPNRAYGMQRYSWPHIAAGKSLIVVGHELTGKTLCFLPQVCNVALAEMDRRPEGDQGPTGIIICHSQSSGRQIAAWIDQLMAGCAKRKRLNYEMLVTLWERGNVASAAYSLSHTVGILLTTADMMLQLKEYHSSAAPILQARTVKCVALDNFGELVRLQPVTTVKLINWFALNYNFNGNRKNPCQLFATGRLWDEQMHPNILHHVANTLIVFEDALEATVFKDVNVEMVEVPENAASDNFLVEMLTDIDLLTYRTVVVCQTQSEAVHLRQEMGKAKINALACYQESTGMPLVAQWRGCQDCSVLIVTDDILPKVRSGAVDILIHYNAATTWSRFKNRFSLFFDSYVAKRDPPGKAFVLVRRSETDYIWLMCDFMLKHHYVRPTGWIQVLFEHRLKMEKENGYLVGVPLCRQVTCFGDCFRRKCRYRHTRWIGEKSIVPDIDIEEGDAIRFQVLTVSSDSFCFFLI